MRYLALTFILLISLLGADWQTGDATVPRLVLLEPAFPSALVRVVKVRAGGVEVTPSVPFQAHDDWFKNIVVVIRNVSNKKLVFVSGQLRFPETGDATAEHLAVMARISAGQRPERSRSPDDVPGPPILVGPGQEATVPIVETFERVKAMIERRRSLSDITTCFVGFNTLYFDDGTEWQSGLYLRADPNTPGRYARISTEEFSASDQEQSQ
jgi:hypothetical protein